MGAVGPAHTLRLDEMQQHPHANRPHATIRPVYVYVVLTSESTNADTSEIGQKRPNRLRTLPNSVS
jgi:hypothetical protein